MESSWNVKLKEVSDEIVSTSETNRLQAYGHMISDLSKKIFFN